MDPKTLAEKAVGDLAGTLGVQLDPVAVVELGLVMVSIVRNAGWTEAERAGLERAARVVDADSAEKAARERK